MPLRKQTFNRIAVLLDICNTIKKIFFFFFYKYLYFLANRETGAFGEVGGGGAGKVAVCDLIKFLKIILSQGKI